MEFARVLRDRCSIRSYDGRRVDDALVAAIIEEASWAPSAGNLQPWHVVVLTNDALRQFLARFEDDALDLVLFGAKLSLLEAATREGRNVDSNTLDQTVIQAAPRHRLSQGPPSHLLFVCQQRTTIAWLLRNVAASVALLCHQLRQKVGVRSKLRYLWLVLSRSPRHFITSRQVRLAGAFSFVYALTLSAFNRGIDSCIIGAFNLNGRVVHRFIGLNPRQEIVVAVALGYRKTEASGAGLSRKRWAVNPRWLG